MNKIRVEGSAEIPPEPIKQRNVSEMLKSKIDISLPSIDFALIGSTIKAGAIAFGEGVRDLYLGSLAEGPLPRIGGIAASILTIPLGIALAVPGAFVGAIASPISATSQGHVKSIKDVPQYILSGAVLGFGLPFASGFIMLGTNISGLVDSIKKKENRERFVPDPSAPNQYIHGRYVDEDVSHAPRFGGTTDRRMHVPKNKRSE